MSLTKQGDELVHAVGQGGRDEAEAGCVTDDQLRGETDIVEICPSLTVCKILTNSAVKVQKT